MTTTNKSRYSVAIMSPKGGPTLRELSSEPGGEGISAGISASAHPLTGCDTLNFSGVRDLVALRGGEVLQVFIEDEVGLHSVFFGAVVVGNVEEPTDAPVNYEASARILLLATAARADRYRVQDTATIAYDLATKYRHPSLKIREEDFPPSGTVLDSFRATGQLADALDELVGLTDDPSVGAGVSPDGFVYFKSNSLAVDVDYRDTDYEEMPTSGNTIVTASVWSFDEQPGVTPWAGPYVPKPLLYVSVPDVQLHEQYGYERLRPIPPSAFSLVNLATFTAVGFAAPENAVTFGATTPSERTGTGTSTFTIANTDEGVFGVQLLYRRDDAVGPVLFRATPASGGAYYEVELPKSDGVMKELPLPLPPHDGPFTRWSSFRITVPAGGIFMIQEFYPFRLDTNKLDLIDRAVVPEQLPGQIVQRGIQPLAAKINLTNAPRGLREAPSAGLRWAWSPETGAATVTDLETSAYDLDPRKTKRVEGYYRAPAKK